MVTFRRRLLFGLILGCLVLFAWLKLVDFRDMLRDFGSITVWFIIPGIVVYILSFVLKALRWQVILSPIRHVRFSMLFKTYISGTYINLLSPVKFGELAMCYLLKRSTSIPMSRSVPTVLVDRGFSLATTLLACLFLPFIAFSLHPFLRWIIVCAVAIFLILIVVLLVEREKQKDILKRIVKIFFFLPVFWQQKAYEVLENFLEIAKLIGKQRKILLPVLVFSIGINVAEGMAFYYFDRSLCVTNAMIYPVDCILGVLLVNMLYLVPTPPAGIGTTEWFYSIVFVFGFGIKAGDLSGVIVLWHVLASALIIILGLYSLVSLGARFFLLPDMSAWNRIGAEEKT